MTTNTILDQAEQRVTDVTTNAQSTQAQQVEAIREEIGHAVYARAKAQLPEIEQAVRQIHRPFLHRVTTIASKAKAPIPNQMQGWLTEMNTLCESVPRQVRAGIDGWERLTPPIWKDGKSVDKGMCVELVGGIRNSLNNWDGCLTRLKELTVWVETYIQESGWPAK